MLLSRPRYLSVTLGLPLLVLWVFQVARAERLPIKIYTTVDGLPNSNINKIVRDSRGFLWFCTAEGLSLFDGRSFMSFGIEDGLPHANVNDILETADGEYWVATQGGLCRFSPRTYSDHQNERFSQRGQAASPSRLFEAVLPADNDNRAHAFIVLFQSRDGTVWCGTAKGIFRVQKSGNAVDLVREDFGRKLDPNSFITTFLEDRFGTFWIGTAKDLYRRWPDGSVAVYGKDHGLPDNNIHDLLEDSKGNLWIGTRFGGLIKLSINATKDPPEIVRVYNSKNGLEANWVFDVYQASDDRLFVGTNGGLVEFSADETRRDSPAHVYTRKNGFSYHEITNINEDRDGNLWLASVNGAMKLAREGFVTFNEQDGIYVSNFQFESHNGDLYYFGYTSADLKSGSAANRILDAKATAVYPAAIGRFDGSAFSWVVPQLGNTRVSWSDKPFILQNHSGEWWVGTTDGLHVFPSVKDFSDLRTARPKVVYTTKDGLAAPVVYALYEDSRGDIWISTISPAGNGLSRWERSSKTLRNMDTTEGLPFLKDTLAVSFQEDRSGNLWIGFSQRGIGRYKDGRLTLFGTDDGLPAGRVNDLFLDQRGRLWIATSRGGLGRLDDLSAVQPSFVDYRVTEGLSSNQVISITEDSLGRIYAATGRGVDQLTPETGRVKHYSTADGLASGQLLHAIRDRNGLLWFGTNQGLSRLTPQPPRRSQPPPVFIKGLVLGGEKQVVSPLGETDIALPEIAPGRNQLQVDFVGVSFASGNKLEYQYRLEGTREDWSTPAEQPTINFASLAPGHYRLLVRAIDSEGVTSPAPASVTFTVLRPFWQRWWFILLATMTLALMSYWFYRYRLSRLLELERVRTRIATDLHDDIGANLTKIAILSEVARQQLGIGDAEQDRPLSSIARISRESVTSMNDIVWAIDPQRDHLRDLLRRMRQHAEETCLPREIELSFKVPENEQDLRLGVDIRRDLYLIFKEAVNNAARHSNCSQMGITLSLEGNRLALEIRDDGNGFDPATEHEGNGLLNIRRRAEKLGAELLIESHPGRGTTIKLSLRPIRSPASSPRR